MFFLDKDGTLHLKIFEGPMETRNSRQSHSPLHAEHEAFIWVMECKKYLRQFSCDFCD